MKRAPHTNGHAIGNGAAHHNGHGAAATAYLATRLAALGVDTRHTDGCWIWHGPLVRGAIVFSIKGVHVSGPRWVYALSRGIVPAGMVFRSCARKNCLAPHHLVDRRPRRRFLASPSALWRLRQAARAGVPLHLLAAKRALSLGLVQRLVGGAG